MRAGLGRHPGAAIATVLVMLFLAVPLAFWLVLRSLRSDPDPALESAQAMAHRLLRGTESIDTEARGDGRFVFRVVHQVSDADLANSTLATHIGVAVCERGDRATDAVRFSYLHYRPSCRAGRVELTPQETSAAADRTRRGGPFVADADQSDEPTPRRIGER